MARSDLHAIPANIITGFLGVGKTTAIQWLLANKPAEEAWAVLVNEFGEIGIDGNLLRASSRTSEKVFIRELPGGCMCCTAGVPFQVALNQLIKQSRPDRLLIEPTGLGHPREVIAMLTTGTYADIIDLQATLTLIDARKIAEPRYREHDIFRQQLQVADRIVANKKDLYGDNDAHQLQEYLLELQLPHVPVHFVEQGRVQYDWLLGPRRYTTADVHKHDEVDFLAEPLSLPDCGYRRIDNRGQGFRSSGWVFAPDFRFDFMKIYQLLSATDVARLKAIFRTERGWVLFNMTDAVLTHAPLDQAGDSRLELIDTIPDAWQDFENQLFQAILPSGKEC